jgi:hypothetical protein
LPNMHQIVSGWEILTIGGNPLLFPVFSIYNMFQV